MKKFNKNNLLLTNQFKNIKWIDDSGISPEELAMLSEEITENKNNLPKCIVKAKTISLILSKSRIAIDTEDIFQDKIYDNKTWSGTVAVQRGKWQNEIIEKYLKEEAEKINEAKTVGSHSGSADFGHTSPNSKLLVEVGFTGLLDRAYQYSEKEGLSQKQKDFYSSVIITLEAVITFIKRLAKETEKTDEENSIALYNIATDKPKNIYEAMQLIIIYFLLHEFIMGTRVRTLGRLDVMLYPFFTNDIKNSTYTKEEIKEMIKFFFNKFWSAKVPFDLPLCLGGIDENGDEVTNELSYLLVETYNELDIHSPKIHIRVSDKTPEDFVKLVLRCIRGGNSSFVFVNDNTVIKSLTSVGITERDAKNYLPIGCYEPAVWGKEIGCTGNGSLNLAKAIEFTFTGGIDFKSGKQISIKSGKINNFDEFINTIKAHIKYMAESGMDYIRKIEKYYGEIGPDPMLSAMYDESMQRGIDVYEGGAEYNNSSYYVKFIATLVDSICAVKKLVFDEKRLTFEQLCEVLKNNWEGNERLRLIALNIPEKYGNQNEIADKFTKEFSEYCASLINNKPNSRSGVFKASIFSIDEFVYYGKRTMATPDGRKDGEVLSKNLCASVGMDKNGITALINSATVFDHAQFPNGTVLDVILHPSAVSGEDGLDAFYSLLKTYMLKGGLALHGNVFNPDDLRKAQENPEKYQNLQVRVCGWNAYFVNLSKTEQDCFIKQAETTYC